MTRTASYRALARLVSYPQAREVTLASLEAVSSYLDGRGILSPAVPFRELLGGSNLEALQEEYVATFDFDAARAPYLGYHLYGEPRQRASYLIRLKQEFARSGFEPESCELPDHLSVLLDFLAHLAARGEDDERRKSFIAHEVLPGVEKLVCARELTDSPWLALFKTAELLLNSDCKEVSSC